MACRAGHTLECWPSVGVGRRSSSVVVSRAPASIPARPILFWPVASQRASCHLLTNTRPGSFAPLAWPHWWRCPVVSALGCARAGQHLVRPSQGRGGGTIHRVHSPPASTSTGLAAAHAPGLPWSCTMQQPAARGHAPPVRAPRSTSNDLRRHYCAPITPTNTYSAVSPQPQPDTPTT